MREIMKVLEDFHHRITRRLTGKTARLCRGERMRMALDRRGYWGGEAVANAGICTEAARKNCGIYSDLPNLWIVYQVRKYARVQLDPEAVGEGPQLGGSKRCQQRGWEWSRVMFRRVWERCSIYRKLLCRLIYLTTCRKGWSRIHISW